MAKNTPVAASAVTPQTTSSEPVSAVIEKDGGGNTYIKGLNNLFFNQLPKGAKVMLCGQIKSIGVKSTPYGDVPQLKGDFIMQAKVGEKVTAERAMTAYLPSPIKDEIVKAVSKLGKWSCVEFRLIATKADNMVDYSVVWEVGPRLLAGESDRVLALVTVK